MNHIHVTYTPNSLSARKIEMREIFWKWNTNDSTLAYVHEIGAKIKVRLKKKIAKQNK